MASFNGSFGCPDKRKGSDEQRRPTDYSIAHKVEVASHGRNPLDACVRRRNSS